ncbi:hypothetical protein [Bradyrhizobium vignae]|uniref:hypothetical protein n=1 Tax=Bradyrhizobium vignae TaxID=1549949 RepID=UPI001359DBEF|nr:hypothetical protein [Bradyrhizobium vignae]
MAELLDHDPHAVANLLQQLAKSLTETGILERCLVDLALRPMFEGPPGWPSNDTPFRLTTSRHLAVATQVPDNKSQAISSDLRFFD